MIKATYCCMPRALQPLFTIATQLLSERLGIDQYNATVEFHADIIERAIEQTGKITKGWMAPSDNQENLERVEKGLPPNHYEMSITLDHPCTMIQAMCHEMTHVKQWLRKELYTKCLRKGSDADSTLYYFNVPTKFKEGLNDTTVAFDEYKDFPWEVEARKSAEENAVWLMEVLIKNQDKVHQEDERMRKEENTTTQ